MLKRVLVGLGMVLVVCGAIASRFWKTEVFDCLVLLLSLGCAYEVVKQNLLHKQKLFLVPVMLFPLIVFLCYYFAPSSAWALLYQMLALLVMLCVCVAAEIIYPKTQKGKQELSIQPDEQNEKVLMVSIRTISYCAYPSMLLGALYGINSFGVQNGLIGLLFVFGVSAFSDTFAFFFGIWLKGPRLCPNISPKKGIIGMIFGFVGGLVAAAIVFSVFRFSNIMPNALQSMSLLNAILMCAICGVFGSFVTQVGDLFESSIKRNLGIKDFGNIFPGHGGFMDRVDGQMFNAVLVFAIMAIFI